MESNRARLLVLTPRQSLRNSQMQQDVYIAHPRGTFRIGLRSSIDEPSDPIARDVIAAIPTQFSVEQIQ